MQTCAMKQNEDDRLEGALGWQYRPRQTQSMLGDEIFSYLKQRDRTFTKNARVIDAWNDVVPPGLQPYCKLDKCVGNTLYVQVKPGPFMHQLQVLSGDLLEGIRQAAPRCGIQKIRVVPLNNNQ